MELALLDLAAWSIMKKSRASRRAIRTGLILFLVEPETTLRVGYSMKLWDLSKPQETQRMNPTKAAESRTFLRVIDI